MFRPLYPKQADSIRRSVKGVLQLAKPLLRKEMQDTLRPLKEEQSDKVLPSDKECASVRLDPNTWQTKMSSLI